MDDWSLLDEMSIQEQMEFSVGREKFFEARTDKQLIELFDSIYSRLLMFLESNNRDVLHFFDAIQRDYVIIIAEALDREITDIFEKCCFICDILLTHIKGEYPNSNYENYDGIIENSLNYFKRIWSDNQDTISGDWFYAIAQKCYKVRGGTRIIISTIWTFEEKKLSTIDSGMGPI